MENEYGKSAQDLYDEASGYWKELEYEKAVKLYRKAADMGHADAKRDLESHIEFLEGIRRKAEERIKRVSNRRGW